METEYIDTEKLSRRRHEACILRVELPLLFWVRLKTGENSLIDLETDLMIHMARRGRYLSLWSNQVKEDEMVAIRNQGEWKREAITKVNRERSRALVSLGDWG